VRLSVTCDLTAAATFFRAARTVTGATPDRLTPDGHDAYPRAIRTSFGERVSHRTNRSLHNHLEQDHRGIKARYRPAGGLNTFATASRFCRLVDDLRVFLRPQSRRNQPLPLAQRLDIHQVRFAHLRGLIAAA
jgi:putative transposase